MAVYTINYSDPLATSFDIPPGSQSGPNSSIQGTSLRLFGRGAVEWGEAVNENFVRLTENFASASPPTVAISGQMWCERKLYFHNTTAGTSQGWYYYDLTETAANKWKLLNGSGVVATTQPTSPVTGQYWYDGTSLWGYYSLGKYEPEAFIKRSYFTGTAAPTASVIPRMVVHVFDQASPEGWSSPVTTFVSTGTAPGAPQVGMLWYNESTGNLSVYTGSAWQEILGPTGASSSQASGIIDMNTNRISNLGAPVAGADAATKTYVDTAVSGAGSGSYLPLSGGTLTGALTVQSTITTTGTILSNSVLHARGGISAYPSGVADDPYGFDSVTMPADTNNYGYYGMTRAGQIGWVMGIDSSNRMFIGSGGPGRTSNTPNRPLYIDTNGNLTIAGQLQVGAQIRNVTAGSTANDAVNLGQMNSAIAAAVAGSTGTAVIYSGSGTYKAGDIAIAYGRIYMAATSGTGGPANAYPPGGGWRQVFPAVYS